MNSILLNEVYKSNLPDLAICPQVTTIMSPNTSAGTAIYNGYSSWDIPSPINSVIDTIPLIGIITRRYIISDRKCKIIYDKVSHKNVLKTFFETGCIAIKTKQKIIYGVYNKDDYEYWHNCITLEFNPEDLNLIDANQFICNINCFDLKITNEEMLDFLNDFEKYNRYFHLKLEEIFKTDKAFSNYSIEEKIRQHNTLQEYLIEIDE